MWWDVQAENKIYEKCCNINTNAIISSLATSRRAQNAA